MIDRRTFINGASTFCILGATEPRTLLHLANTSTAVEDDPMRWVDPRIGTGGFGHCYPGATVPFGAVQLSPDTFNDGWNWCSGYHLSDSSLMGFSHTHLSGTGCGDLLDFLVMAGTGPVKLVPGTRENPDDGYRSRFDHADELIEPGYYSVLLKDYKIRAELTATERTGLHKYTFPRSEESYLIIDLDHSYLTKGRSSVTAAQIAQVDPTTLLGGHTTNAWGLGRRAFFALKVSKMPTRTTFYADGERTKDLTNLTGKSLKCVLHFSTQADEVIFVKVGISGTSAQGAKKNLDTELPHWNFEGVRNEARDRWRRQLSKIQVKTDNQDHKRVFYTALYHLSLGPTLFDDVDGQYRGMDGNIHTLPLGQHNYTTFSLWDTYRAAHPTHTLLEPERASHFVNSLIRMASESPVGMPVWPLQGTETGCMTGYHSAAVIAEACNKGVGGVDYKRAYSLMMKRAMDEDYRGLGLYRRLGYIPADREPESVSKAFEYCYDDWSIAHVAKCIGKHADAAMLVKRSQSYRTYFDRDALFIRPKMEDGSWATPFDSKAMGHSDKWRDFTESDSWQTTFAVQHDPAGLIALFGGRHSFVAKLDQLFVESSELKGDVPPDITGMIGQYAHGNEPSHHIAYLYVYAGAPHKTQRRIRSLLETMYSAKPDGMQGNEDVGQMSAWFILSALGFYPVDAVSGNYVVGSPLFDHASLLLASGGRLEIEVLRDRPDDQYIHGFSINGKPQRRLWFNHREISQGGKLTFRMGAAPSLSFAIDQASAPPSLVL